ncbi:hypothetical protein XPN_1650, partial [Xanthomonas arboricola pv. pruni MAFF 301427]
RDHRRHRRHRLPDQYPGLERSSGSRARRRTGTRLRRGRLGSTYAGTAFGGRSQGDQAPDPGLGHPHRQRRRAGVRSRQHHAAGGQLGAARHRHHERGHQRLARAGRRHHPGQPDRHPDGRKHPAERRAGGRSHRGCTRDGRPGRATGGCSGRVPPGTAGPTEHLAGQRMPRLHL